MGLAATDFDVPQCHPTTTPKVRQISRLYEIQPTANRIYFEPDTPRSSGIDYFEQIRPNQNVVLQLRSLQLHYTTLDDDRLLMEILEGESTLYSLLNEAVTPLHHSFGENRIIHLRIQCSDDDLLIKVAVQLPAEFRDAADSALLEFDNEWWLNNCDRSNGNLVFDYEIV